MPRTLRAETQLIRYYVSADGWTKPSVSVKNRAPATKTWRSRGFFSLIFTR